jgi:Tol biopolymer transport system component
MNRYDPFERDITMWLNDAASPRMPDFRDDLLQRTAATSQRPRWSFPERWLPMTAITAGRRAMRPVPWRTIALLALLVALLTAGALIYAGSRSNPAPMLGPAANGLVAYDTGGDLYTVDPASGTRRPIITGETQDHAPQYSLDGTRLFFLRGDGKLDRPVVADSDGRNQTVLGTEGLALIDPGSIVWSPDGRTVALLGGSDGAMRVYLADTISGTVWVASIPYLDGKIYWRPPDGRAFMFTQGTAGHDELAVYSLDTGSVDVLDTNGFTTNVRGSGWSADGTRYAFHHLINNASYTEVVDVATGTFHALPVAYGELSNDGRRVVGMEPGRGGLCVIPVDGSTCTAVTEPYGNGWGWYYRWSPDDASIITSRIDDKDFVLDPDGPPTQAQPSWMADGGDSWQRRGRD